MAVPTPSYRPSPTSGKRRFTDPNPAYPPGGTQPTHKPVPPGTRKPMPTDPAPPGPVMKPLPVGTIKPVPGYAPGGHYTFPMPGAGPSPDPALYQDAQRQMTLQQLLQQLAQQAMYRGGTF